MKILERPVTARNLTAWFVTVPVTEPIPDYQVLEEAMAAQTGLVYETGNVNELLIENPGDFDLFIQAGDIVKGGRQDRTLGADFIVPARSGAIPIPAFCVEAARWRKRRNESDVHFSTSSNFLSSKKLRTALQKKNQGEVWQSVEEEQIKLCASIGAMSTSQESPTSLQLSYELQEMSDAVNDYLAGLESAPTPDAAGVIWAINGKISHADIYGNSALFKKVWKKLVRAASFEAIGESKHPPGDLPVDIAQVSSWLQEANSAQVEEENLPPRTRLATRRSESQLRLETLDVNVPGPIHLSVLAQ